MFPRRRDSTASLGNLLRCLTSLIAKNFYLTSNLSLPSFSLKSLPSSYHYAPWWRVSPHLSCRPLQVLEGCNKVSPQPSLLQAEQPQPSQPFLTAEVLQPSDHLCGLLWTHSNSSMSLLCWGLQRWTQDSRWGLTRVEQRGRIPSLDLLATLLGMQPRMVFCASLILYHYPSIGIMTHFYPSLVMYLVLNCITGKSWLETGNLAAKNYSQKAHFWDTQWMQVFRENYDEAKEFFNGSYKKCWYSPCQRRIILLHLL